jgi:GTP cyclohydrolase I
MSKTILNHGNIGDLAHTVREAIIASGLMFARCYPIPRGGVAAAYAVYNSSCPFAIVNTPEEADFFIDDIIDSGETMRRYCDEYPGKMFFALIDKLNGEYANEWVVFPWEVTSEGTDESATDIVTRLLQFVGEDATRGGLLETPHRVLKAWKHWCGGYDLDAKSVLKTFEDGAENCDEMVVRVVPFYSHCEHHMAAIIGHAVVAYVPNSKIVGLSNIDRVVDMFARRLQVQERLTNQIAEAIMENLEPKGVGVWVNARHLCIESRGVRNQNSVTDTLALRGVFKEDARTRAEFIAVARTKVQ